MIKMESTLQGRRPKRALQDITVVDVDIHIHESPEALAPYCEMPWRKSLEFLKDVPRRYLDIPGFAPAMSPYAPFPDSGGKRRNTVTSAKQMREDLDELGVDIGILFPDHFLTLA